MDAECDRIRPVLPPCDRLPHASQQQCSYFPCAAPSILTRFLWLNVLQQCFPDEISATFQRHLRDHPNSHRPITCCSTWESDQKAREAAVLSSPQHFVQSKSFGNMSRDKRELTAEIRDFSPSGVPTCHIVQYSVICQPNSTSMSTDAMQIILRFMQLAKRCYEM